MAQSKFVRFTVLPGSGGQMTADGLFTAAYDLAHADDTPEVARDHLISLLTWFSENLKRPSRFNRGGGKGWRRRDTRGLSWFKPQAREHISKVHELRALLDTLGVQTKQHEAVRVGYVVYEDDHQVVAEPFADLK